MKQLTILILSSLFCFSCVSTEKQKKNDFEYFNVSFSQNNQTVDSTDHEVNLKRQPFNINFKFLKPEGIIVIASSKPDIFNAARMNEKIDLTKPGTDKNWHEELFNKEASILISDKEFNYWNYTGPKDHRFSEVEIKNSVILCKREVKYFIHQADNKLKEPVESFKNNFLYLVFLKTEWNADYTRRIEKKRDFYKIIFPAQENGKPEPLVILKSKSPVQLEKHKSKEKKNE